MGIIQQIHEETTVICDLESVEPASILTNIGHENCKPCVKK